MFAVDVEGRPRRVFEEPRVVIGRSTRSDLVLASAEVSRRHAIVIATAEGFTLEDTSASGTRVGGAYVARVRVTPGSRIQIGPFALTLELVAAADPTEQRLLAAIATRDDAASRLVYADWLEQRGELARAEFLRVQEELAALPADRFSGAAPPQTERLRALAASIEMAWRYRVARPAVEGCEPRFSFKCPREWAAMTATDRADVRHCDACNKHVFYCPTVDDAREHAERGHCVVVDIIPRRRLGDLEPELGPPPMPGMIAPPVR